MKVLSGSLFACCTLVFAFGCSESSKTPTTPKTVVTNDVPETGTDGKMTIKQVMQKAEKKGGLYDKVKEGNASTEEKEQLVGMFVALSQQTPRKGTPESWQEKTTALVEAAKGVAHGDAGAMDNLKKANDCMACHSAHRGVPEGPGKG